MEYFLLAIIALSSGIVGSLVGLGGGVILIPATLFIGINLGFFPEITPQKVVGLSVVMMIFTGLSSTLSYMKNKQVDFKSGFIFFIGSIPGTMFGAWLNKGLDLPSFNLFFGLFLVFLSILLFVRDKLKPIQWFVQHGKQTNFTDKEGKKFVYGYPIWFAILFTFVVGTVSGLFGIGGGSLLVPAMVLLFLFPPHVAVATSMFMVFLSSIVNSASHIYLGNVPWIYTIPVIIGAYIGAKVGAGLNKRMQSKTIVFVLQIVMLLIGIRSIIDGLFN
ncbi:sulfite exporter TauE/SafE family protein [Ureibacillus chungkukjangi]|uniref:sulfite exporter TauE/SafE family protein n=1 Tax=Ureibacillus chungkukjangi TaxID=1202712 RepID=UPI0020412B5E|nr:sulfite exporter TauE/SafE family protein [Ureibacillus chungkukjangi]MCM3388174.1 sulfite exporter TauE/SafE family protein [Ureibacillus chungkukjangi]